MLAAFPLSVRRSSAAVLIVLAALGACADQPTEQPLAPTSGSKTTIAAPLLVTTPAKLDFGYVALGSTSTPQYVTIKNDGTADLVFTSLKFGGTNSKNFAGGGSGGSCADLVSMTPGQICVIAVVFKPIESGALTASLDIESNGGNQSIMLLGTTIKTAPSISVSPTSIHFGSQTVGTSSAPQQVTVYNLGDAEMSIGSIAISGANAGDFAWSYGGASVGPSGFPCQPSAKLAVGASCVTYVSFTPAAEGFRQASLDIKSDGGDASVMLTGSGAVADIAVSVGATPSPAQAGKPLTYNITITNNGPGAASSITLTDVIPASTTYMSYGGVAHMTCNTPAVGGTGTVSCTSLAPLASGASFTMTLTVKALSGGKGTISNTVNVAGTAPDPVFLNNSATVVTTVYGRK